MIRKCFLLSIIMVLVLSLFACGGAEPVEGRIVSERLVAAVDSLYLP